MRFTDLLTDESVLSEVGERLARLRLRRNQTQSHLATEAGVSKRTLERLEAGQSVQLTNLIRVLRALRILDRLEVVLPAPEPSPVELLEMRGKERQRASPSTADEIRSPASKWTWGDED